MENYLALSLYYIQEFGDFVVLDVCELKLQYFFLQNVQN